jgi:carbamate kinase
LVRSEEASTKVPPFTLDLCVASTQGAIGSLLETAFRNALTEDLMAEQHLAVLTTQVVVDANDPALANPTKPIGLFYSQYRIAQIRDELAARGWGVVEDSGRGFRPVVPSPRPLEVLNASSIEMLLEQGVVVIAGGGGGVPHVRQSNGRLERIEAVIDKDRTAAVLAANVGASTVIFLTGVPWVELNYGTPFARRLETVTISEMERHLSQGQFPAGSMGPKVESALRVASAGAVALITSADALPSALSGNAGTRIIA